MDIYKSINKKIKEREAAMEKVNQERKERTKSWGDKISKVVLEKLEQEDFEIREFQNTYLLTIHIKGICCTEADISNGDIEYSLSESLGMEGLDLYKRNGHPVNFYNDNKVEIEILKK